MNVSVSACGSIRKERRRATAYQKQDMDLLGKNFILDLSANCSTEENLMHQASLAHFHSNHLVGMSKTHTQRLVKQVYLQYVKEDFA